MDVNGLHQKTGIPLLSILLLFGLTGCNSVDHTVIEPAPSATTAPSAAVPVISAKPEDPGGSSFYGIRLLDPAGAAVQEWASDSFAMVQPIVVEQAKEPRLLVYSTGNELPEILEEDGSRTALAAPKWTDNEQAFGNDYGFNLLFADRVLNDEIYAVRGNRSLYRVNIANGTTRKLYASEQPINGIAASPDNSRVAVLVADAYLTPEEQLLVFDREGNKVYNLPKASYASHSDGYLFVYPMAWTDNHHVTVPLSGYEQYGVGGVNVIHVDEDTAVFRERRTLPEEALQLLEQHAGIIKFPDDLRFLLAPGANPKVYAVEGNNFNTWLIDTASRQVVNLGGGRLLRWTDEGNLLISVSRADEPFYYIGSSRT